MFPVTSKPTPPTVFNLQASDWVHCEEEMGAYAQMTFNTYKLFKKFLQIFKIVYFATKNSRILKNFIKFIILFFSKIVIWVYVYMY